MSFFAFLPPTKLQMPSGSCSGPTSTTEIHQHCAISRHPCLLILRQVNLDRARLGIDGGLHPPQTTKHTIKRRALACICSTGGLAQLDAGCYDSQYIRSWVVC